MHIGYPPLLGTLTLLLYLDSYSFNTLTSGANVTSQNKAKFQNDYLFKTKNILMLKLLSAL